MHHLHGGIQLTLKLQDMEQIVACPKCYSDKVSAILDETNALHSVIFTYSVIRLVCSHCGNVFKLRDSVIKTMDKNGNVVYHEKNKKHKGLRILLAVVFILVCIGLIIYVTYK